MTALTLLSFSYAIVLFNADGLKAMIEAEATILGFFALIFTYMLTSIDTRIDKFEQRKCEIGDKKIDAEKHFNEVLVEAKEQKNFLVKQASLIGSMMVISMLLCIGLLGGQNYVLDALQNRIDWIVGLWLLLAILAFGLFFEAIWFFFRMFRQSVTDFKQ